MNSDWITIKASRNANCFEKLEQIGEGTYGQVFKAREIATGEIVALKRILKDTKTPHFPDNAVREIMILKKLDHPNVIKLKEIVMSKRHEDYKQPYGDLTIYRGNLYLVFEYMDYDLTGLFQTSRYHFTVPQVKSYMKQLLSGLRYCHQNQVLHRDIKGFNILINNEGILKLADFGMARELTRNKYKNLTNNVVTRWYRAPELLLGATQYGPAVDMWSVGCVFAELLCGYPLLPGKTEADQIRRIYELCGLPDEVSWPGVSKLPCYKKVRPSRHRRRRLKEIFSQCDKHAVDLLDKMLTLDPAQRISATDALDAEYFSADPIPCYPKSLQQYEASHKFETDKKQKLQNKDTGKRRGTQYQAQQEQNEDIAKRHKTQHQAQQEQILGSKFNPICI